MPVVVEPDAGLMASLLRSMPPGTHGVETTERLMSWLDNRNDEYVVVLGPRVPLADALSAAGALQFSRPTTSVLLVRPTVDAESLRAAMQAGARDVVPEGDAASLVAAVDRAYQFWIALRGPGGATHLGKLITVFSPKGGVGKTTMSVNLALALFDRGARQVCLVDLDLAFGDVAITMQLFPSHSIEHAIGAEDALDYAMVASLLTRHEDGLMVLAAPSLPDARDRISPALVARILRTLQENFDYVVVDTAPSFDDQTLTALDETDECVIVATLDVPTLKNVKVALETLDMLSLAKDRRHLLLNRADDAVGISADKVEAILGMTVAAQISTSIDIAAATNAGRPIVVSQPHHPSSVAIQALATQLAGGVSAPVHSATGQDDDDHGSRRRGRKRR